MHNTITSSPCTPHHTIPYHITSYHIAPHQAYTVAWFFEALGWNCAGDVRILLTFGVWAVGHHHSSQGPPTPWFTPFLTVAQEERDRWWAALQTAAAPAPAGGATPAAVPPEPELQPAPPPRGVSIPRCGSVPLPQPSRGLGRPFCPPVTTPRDWPPNSRSFHA